MSGPAEIPLVRAFPDLARIPRQPLGHWPTPVMHLQKFGADHGLPHLYVKREDLSHPVCGGNKVRGLEFLLADALANRSPRILTVGAAGSHHVARTAWHAASLGMPTTAVLLRQPMAEYVRRNLRLASTAGANLILANPLTLLPRLITLRWFSAEPSYFIAPGGTTPLACVGHVNAALELKAQIDRGEFPSPDYIYVPLGSLGTCAGLLVGARLAGIRARIIGVVTSYRWYATAGRIRRIADKTLNLLRRVAPSVPPIPLDADDVTVITTALGPGYAQFTPRSMELARSMVTREGISLDGTYSAKAFETMHDFARQSARSNGVHLFWHTYHQIPSVPSDETQVATRIAKYMKQPSQPLDNL